MTTVAVAAAHRPRLISRPLLLVLLADVGGLTSFYLLLSVVAQYAAGGAGLATGALMFATVAAELVTPRLVARFGYRAVLGGGLLLLGAPVLALPLSNAPAAVLAVCVLRGLGLGMVFVVGGALSAALVAPERRGEGLGVIGAIAGVPAVIGIPLGLWLAGQAGYPVVFLVGAAVALLGLLAVPSVPSRLPAEERHDGVGLAAAARTPALLRPSVVFTGAAMAAGVVVTFLPAAVPHGALAAVALLAHSAAATLSRWWAGRLGDRHGAARLLVPGVAVGALGMLALVLPTHPVPVLAGMALAGTGFGIVQSASLAMLYERVSPSGYGTVTALWSIAYDGGLGLGAAGFGLLAAHGGYPVGFASTGVVMAATLLVLLRRRHVG